MRRTRATSIVLAITSMFLAASWLVRSVPAEDEAVAAVTWDRDVEAAFARAQTSGRMLAVLFR